MACRRLQRSRWGLTISVVSVLLGLLMAPRLLARAAAAETLVTTDYWLSHTSSESFYAQYKLDPQVVLHVREVVLAGRERTVSKDGKVVLLLHGATVPGFVAFDLDHEQCSLMRYLARAGWDTFTLDFEGYGLSTRPRRWMPLQPSRRAAPRFIPRWPCTMSSGPSSSSAPCVESRRSRCWAGPWPPPGRPPSTRSGIRSRSRSWYFLHLDTSIWALRRGPGHAPTPSRRRTK